MKNSPEKRNFNRFSLKFKLKVEARGREGKKFTETTQLENISGNGARFLTSRPDRYFSGQPLELAISLPGTDEVKARMKGEAAVVRVDQVENGRASVSVEFLSRLDFQREDL